MQIMLKFKTENNNVTLKLLSDRYLWDMLDKKLISNPVVANKSSGCLAILESSCFNLSANDSGCWGLGRVAGSSLPLAITFCHVSPQHLEPLGAPSRLIIVTIDIYLQSSCLLKQLQVISGHNKRKTSFFFHPNTPKSPNVAFPGCRCPLSATNRSVLTNKTTCFLWAWHICSCFLCNAL